MLRVREIAAETPTLREALEAANLPTADLLDGRRSFFAAEDDGTPVGYGGYELCGEDALLRSVVVLEDQRGRGYGRLVVEEVLDHAAAHGARRAYLLTTSAESFFAHTGFHRIARTDAPAAILGTRQATTICSTAPLLARALDDRA